MPKPLSATSIVIGVAFFCACGAFAYFMARLTSMGGPLPITPAPAQSEGGAPNANAPEAQQSYTVRGRVISLPSSNGKQPFEIHHEEIPGFVGKSGAVVGMKEMIMPFPDLAPGVTLDGLAAGDLVEFVFEVRWNAPPRTLVTRISKLPADAVLKLGPILEEAK